MEEAVARVAAGKAQCQAGRVAGAAKAVGMVGVVMAVMAVMVVLRVEMTVGLKVGEPG
jgi:hypothetical protein